jgi:glycosyltransferase involved in cell wall biosynthesis
LNLLYNVSDVHLNTCVGEGFGLPIMDAQACGCPTIVPDFAAAGEIGFGMKITEGMKRPLVPGGLQFLVDPNTVVDALEDAYCCEGPEWRKEMAEQAREYSLDVVMERYMKPVLEKIEGEIKK